MESNADSGTVENAISAAETNSASEAPLEADASNEVAESEPRSDADGRLVESTQEPVATSNPAKNPSAEEGDDSAKADQVESHSFSVNHNLQQLDEEMQAQNETFAAIDQEVQTLLLASSDQVSKTEFEKLYKTLQQYRETERRLMKKCRDQTTEVAATATKIQSALKSSQDDRSTIATLKNENKKAWKMVEVSNEKEAKAREMVSQLKVELSNLAKQRYGDSGKDTTGSVEKKEKDIMHELEVSTAPEQPVRDNEANLAQQNVQITTLQMEISQNTQKFKEMETRQMETDIELQSLRDTVATKKSEFERDLRIREKLEKEVKDLKTGLELKNNDIKTKLDLLSRGKEEIAKLEIIIKDQKAAYEKVLLDQDALNATAAKTRQDLDEQLLLVRQLLADNEQKSLALKAAEDEFQRLAAEQKGQARSREGLMKKLKLMDIEKGELLKKQETFQGQLRAAERDLETHKKQLETDKKTIDDLCRERDILAKNLHKSTGSTQKQANLVKLFEQTKHSLENEIQVHKEEVTKCRKIIYQFEKERDRYVNEAEEAKNKSSDAFEEVKIRDLQIFDYKKKLSEAEVKLKAQQNMYEAVRSDRNLYSKNLIEAQDEITESKKKQKILSHQIDQLKEEISAKEAAFVKEKLLYSKAEKENEALNQEMNKLKQQYKLSQEYIQNQNSSVQKLTSIISEADSERTKQMKKYEDIIQERDILGTQLIRRNDELALLYEKIKIQQSTLNKGEIQYRERLEDLRVLKLEIKKLRRERALLQRATSNIDTLRNEVYRLQKELLSERTRVKALEEELENPMNIHRWRKLEGSDPSTFEMVQKIQTLQKRLIAKTEEVVEKELGIQEKEKLYAELKNILARQPGPEIAEQLIRTQQRLKDRTKSMKAMASELNMYQTQVSELRFELERLNRELQDSKSQYYELRQKRRQLHAK